MKNIILVFSIFIIGLSANGQVLSNGQVANQYSNENVFLDASTLNNGTINDGKGLLFPTTDLTAFTLKVDNLDGINFPSYFDGMIVYNVATSGSTNDPLLTTQTSGLVPGFYYFSNPDGALNGNVTAGRWLPLGGQSATVKSKTVQVTVAANPTTATLELGTGTILANEVATFLGAKIYDATGANLIMTADNAYDKTDNTLTTGNGVMFQVLPQGTYQVVVEYR